MLIPVAVYFLFANLFTDLFANETIFTLAVLLASVYYLSIFLFFYAQFVVFYLDIWIVTNDRIIDVYQHGLFARTISEFDLYRIQDVTVEIKGLFASLFNYGNVNIKTASGNANITFYNIPNPNEVRETLVELAEDDRKFHHDQNH
jgi:membrane protein YdbS with pleckstrin-like domain